MRSRPEPQAAELRSILNSLLSVSEVWPAAQHYRENKVLGIRHANTARYPGKMEVMFSPDTFTTHQGNL